MDSMHTEFLLAALEQARLGRGQCAPNPSVGAVAVQDNQIIAKAWHQGAGTPHAEQLLLSELEPGLEDVILYVTLEPCNHWGRTPPCVNTIVQYGIKKVVFAYQDPNPVVQANDTPAMLKKHGIDVVHYPLTEITAFYDSYCHWIHTGKPWMTIKIAQSLDGKIAGSNRERVQLSNESCAKFTHINRQYADAILTTSKTIINDEPLLNARLNGQSNPKCLLILDRTLSLTGKERVFNFDSKKIIFHDKNIKPATSLPLVEYVGIDVRDNGLKLDDVISSIGEHGFHDVWIEAGARLFNALHQSELVNQTYIYLTPTVMGDDAYSCYVSPLEFDKAKMVSWQQADNNMILSLVWNQKKSEEICLQG